MRLEIPYPEEGTYVIGGTGTRKSTLMLHRMLAEIKEGNAFALLDPHRELAETVATHLPPERRRSLDMLAGFALNLFACRDTENPEAVGRTLDQVMQAFAKLWGAEMTETPRLSRYLTNAALPMILTGGTMTGLLHFLSDKPSRDRVLSNVSRSYGYVHNFWREHDALDKREKEQRIESTISRVAVFVEHPITGRLFSRSEGIDWRGVMDAGTSVLVLLDPQLEKVTNFVGAVILGQILNAVLSRSDTTHRPPYGLFVDEYDRLATASTASLFTQGRKYKLRPLIAHQHRGNLSEEMKRATLQVANVLVFRVAPPDNEVLSGIFDATPPEPEIRGTEPIRAVDPHPVESLLKNGHPNVFLVNAATDFFQSIYEVIERPSENPEWFERRFSGYYGIYLGRKESLKSGLRAIDDMLVQVMRGGAYGSVERQLHLTLPVALHLRAYLGYVTDGKARLVEDFDWTTSRNLNYEERKLLMTPEERPWTPRDQVKMVDLICRTIVFHDRQVAGQDRQFVALEDELERFGHDPKEGSRLAAFIWQLLGISALFAAEPIYVNTGRFTDVRERPRSRDDMRSQIANELATLPTGRARTRIRTAKGFDYREIVVDPPPPDGRWRLEKADSIEEFDEPFLADVFHDDGPPPSVRPLT